MNTEEKLFFKQLWELYLVFYNIFKNNDSVIYTGSFFPPNDLRFYLTFRYENCMYLPTKKIRSSIMKQVVRFYHLGSSSKIHYTLHQGYKLIDRYHLQEYFLQKIKLRLTELI